MLSTNQQGAIVETAVAHAASKLGIGVAKPLADERYDLILDLRPHLLRIQCKSAVRRGNVVSIACYSSRRSASGFIKRRYSKDEVDAIAAYCAELERCFLLPVARIDGRSEIQLRLKPTRNNQRVGVNWADDFDFAATLTRPKGP